MLSADNRLVYKTLRCITKLTSLATSAFLVPSAFAAVELGQLVRGS